MGWAEKIAGSEPSKGGVYILPGVFAYLWIEQAIFKDSRKGDELFIAEFKILESEAEARPRGTEMAWAPNLSAHESAAGNVKAFIAAAMGISEKDVDAAGIEAVVSSDNPLRGRLIRCEASNIKTKKDNDFTVCNWTAVPESKQVDARKMYDAAGFAPF